jgi:hypothetical protein
MLVKTNIGISFKFSVQISIMNSHWKIWEFHSKHILLCLQPKRNNYFIFSFLSLLEEQKSPPHLHKHELNAILGSKDGDLVYRYAAHGRGSWRNAFWEHGVERYLCIDHNKLGCKNFCDDLEDCRRQFLEHFSPILIQKYVHVFTWNIDIYIWNNKKVDQKHSLVSFQGWRAHKQDVLIM